MSRMDEYERGRRDGVREAVTWLHKRAREMNDPRAVSILNAAADHLGGWRSRNAAKTVPAPLSPSIVGRQEV